MATTTGPESESTANQHLERLRRLLLALGAAGLAVGLATLVVRGPGDNRWSGPVLDLVGNDWVVVGAVGAVSLLIALGAVAARLSAGRTRAMPPNPEGVHGVPHIGAAFDEFHAGGGVHAWLVADDHPGDVHARLRAAAIDTVMRETNCTRGEARERIEAGTWTDDDTAAAFLADPPEPTPADRLLAALGLESAYQHAARTTAAEIVRRDPEVER